MNTHHLNALIAESSGGRTRRGLLAALGGLPALLSLAEVAEGRRKKRKKRRRRKRSRAKRPIFTQSCPGPFDTTVVALSGLAQTFTAERSGSLTAAEVETTALTGDEDFVLEIRTLDESGVPTATILASAEITNVSPTLRGTCDPPAAIVEDQGYALVLTVGEGQQLTLRGRSADVCTGQLFGVLADGSFSPDPIPNTDIIFSVTIES